MKFRQKADGREQTAWIEYRHELEERRESLENIAEYSETNLRT